MGEGEKGEGRMNVLKGRGHLPEPAWGAGGVNSVTQDPNIRHMIPLCASV